MWLLTGLKEENKDQVFYVYQSKEYTVSRKGGDVTLSNDQSISRLHARIIHGTQKENQILVMDAGSKYGTFLVDTTEDKKKLTANEAVAFKSGNILQFGLQWNVFRLEYMPLVVCASMLGAAEKLQLKETVQNLNGELVNDWQENTTHLTMNKITLTPKVVCALGYAKPLVNLDFWAAVKDATLNNKQFPNYEEFIPPLVEKALNKNKVSFKVDPGRRTLFAGKTFITCCPSQKRRIENMVAAAGGKVLNWTEGSFTKERLINSPFLIMKPSPNETQVDDDYHELMKFLKDNEFRAIGESEIGISVVYCSTEKYCNPRFDFNSNLVKIEASMGQQSMGSCLVPETQDATKDSKHFEEMCIPESVPLLTPANKSRSRLIDDDEAETSNHKEIRKKSVFEKPEIKMEPDDTTMRSEATVDASRDIFASTQGTRASLSRRTSSSSTFSCASTSRKRPSVFLDEDDEENAFSFGSSKSKRRQSPSLVSAKVSASSHQKQDENEVQLRENTAPLSVASTNSKKSRLCIEDPDDVFNFPSDRKSSTNQPSSSSSSSSSKRRISLLDDEVDSKSRSDIKRTRLEDPGTSKASLNPVQRQPAFSWSQEMRNIDEKVDAVGFTARRKPIKVETSEDGNDEYEFDEYLKAFRNKVVIETKDLIPAQKGKPVQRRQYDDGPNFKKFRKNKICRVNVTKIIGITSLRQFQLNNREDIWGNQLEEEVDDPFPQFDAPTRRGRGR